MSEYIYDTSIEATFLHEQKHEEIVRCFDCVWFTNSSHYGAYCTNFGSPLGDDSNGFCAWGERRNNE